MEFVSGGYYVTRAAQRDPERSPGVLPDELWSASGCVCQFFPDAWALEWVKSEDRAERAVAMGVPVDEAVAWATEAFTKEFGWPNAFYTLDAAQEVKRRWFAADAKVAILGLGLDAADVERFLEAEKPDTPQTGESGMYECVRLNRPMAGGGERLGFEVLSVHYGVPGCSWICSGAEREFRPNERGFLESIDEARQCAASMKESGVWLPWLVIRYS